MHMDPYKTLEIARTASDGEIKKAYRKLARTYHPDVNQSPEAEDRFKAVNDAYDILKDPEKRANFDRFGTLDPPSGRADDWQEGFEFSQHTGRAGDPFADFFGTFGRRGPADFTQSQANFAADQHVRLPLSLDEAIRGAQREVHLRQPVIDAHGTVVLEDRCIAVSVPPGVLPGQFLRLRGQGLTAQKGVAPGDLFVEIVFKPHPTYRIEGKDLHLELPVTPWEAALGTQLVLATPGGDVKLSVPPNARSGQKLRLKGRGLPAKPPGHLIATLKIVNPDATSAEARAVFEKMAGAFDFDPRKKMGA